MQIRVIGLDIAKHVFQVHAVDAGGRAVAQVRLRRRRCSIIFLQSPAVPTLARDALMLLVDELASVWRRVEAIEKRLVGLHKADALSRQLASIPGVGPITAMAIANTVSDPSMFRSGREFAAWLGLTPKSRSIGGKDKLGRISKRGDHYIRHLLHVGVG
jgi:transposase